MNSKQRTKYILGVLLIILFIYDVITYLIVGGKASISTVIGQWLEDYWWFALMFGFLFGHFVGMMSVLPTQYIIILVSFILGLIITRY